MGEVEQLFSKLCKFAIYRFAFWKPRKIYQKANLPLLLAPRK